MGIKQLYLSMVTMSLCGMALFFAPYSWQTVACLSLIGFVGLPHGGVDAYKMWSLSDHRLTRCTRLLANYIAVLLIAWAIHWRFPDQFFAVFLAISVYHFGASRDLFPENLSTHWLPTWIGFLSKGVLIVFLPGLFHPSAVNEILSIASSVDFARWYIKIAPLLVFAVLIAVFITAAKEYTTSTGKTFAKALLVQTLLLLLLFSILPVLVSFTLYFVFIHSIPQMRKTLASFSSVNGKVLLAVGVIFSVPPIVLFVLALRHQPNFAAWAAQGSSYIFVMLAVLHFPHCWLGIAENKALALRGDSASCRSRNFFKKIGEGSQEA